MRPSGLESAADYERLIGLCPAVLFRQCADFSFKYVSPKISEWTGFPAEEWLRRPKLLQEILYEADAPGMQSHLDACANSDAIATTVFRIRNRETGRLMWICERRRVVRGSNAKPAAYEGLWSDVSVQVLAMQQRGAAEWHRTFSLMTMGAAHDLNNKLTGILSFSELHLSELDATSPLGEALRTIRDNARTASQLLHQMATLHEANTGNCEHIDLNSFVTSMAAILTRVISSRVKIETALHHQPLAVHVDQVRFQQLIMGWAMQAAGRMPRRGTLALKTASIAGSGTGFAGLTITDTGTQLPTSLTTNPLESGPLDPAETPAITILRQLRDFTLRYHGTCRIESSSGSTSLELLLPVSNFAEDAARLAGKRWILIVSKTAQKLSEFLKALEEHAIVAVVGSEAWEEQLDPGRFEWQAVLFHGPPPSMPGLLAATRARKLPTKTVVYLSSGDVAELDSNVKDAADLLIGPDLPQGGVVRKIVNLVA
jgi:hypothetical protein